MDATTFPISFQYHLIFSLVAFAFFALQFIRLRRPHQLILAIAIASSLLIYIDKENQSLFHAVGLFVLVMLVGAIVLSVVSRIRRKRSKTADMAHTEKDRDSDDKADDDVDHDAEDDAEPDNAQNQGQQEA